MLELLELAASNGDPRSMRQLGENDSLETDLQLFISKAMFYQIKLSSNHNHKKLLTSFQFQAVELIKKIENLESKNDENSDEVAPSTDNKESNDVTENEDEVPQQIITREFFLSLENDAKPKYVCEHCKGVEFDYLQSLQRHFRKVHKDKPQVSSKDYPDQTKIICLLEKKNNPGFLCNNKVKKSEISRHLRLSHKVERPPNSKFSGFFSDDNRKSYYVCWQKPNEDLPESVQQIKIEKNVVVVETDSEMKKDTVHKNENECTSKNETEDCTSTKEAGPVSEFVKLVMNNYEKADDVVNMDAMEDKSLEDNTIVFDESFELFREVGEIVRQKSDEVLKLDIWTPKESTIVQGESCQNDETNDCLDASINSSLHVIDHEETIQTSSFGEIRDKKEESINYDEDSNGEDDSHNNVKEKYNDEIPNEDLVGVESDHKVKHDDVEENLDSSYESEDELDDSYQWMEDEDDFNSRRSMNRDKRYQKRSTLGPNIDLKSLPANQAFMERFKSSLLSKNFVTTNKEDVSTLRFSMGHLFEYQDCFLNFVTMKNPDFDLGKLLDFQGDYVSLPSPTPWITACGGKSGKEFPSRRVEQLKSHARLREFLKNEINQLVFKGEEIKYKREIKLHLDDLEEEVRSLKLFNQLHKLQNQEKMKKKQMEEIIEGEKDAETPNEYLAVRKWYLSEESRLLDTEMKTIWKESLDKEREKDDDKSESISTSDFDKFARFSFFELALCDMSRPGTLEAISNADYLNRKAVYLPDGFGDSGLDNLPPGWNVYQAPNKRTKPTRYEIRIIGDQAGVKGNEFRTVTINSRVMEILEKYQDLKGLKKTLRSSKLKDKFFVKSNGSDLPRLQKYEGSLLDKFAKVTGLKKFSFTSLRKALEAHIINSSQAEYSKEINAHSTEVGASVYDSLAAARRSVFMNSVNLKDGSVFHGKSQEADEEQEAKRLKQFDEAHFELVEEAKAFLLKLKEKKYYDFCPMAMKEEDRTFLKSCLENEETGELLYLYPSQF